MTSPYVTTAILDTIRGAGFHVGWTSTVDVRTGELRRIVNAVDARTGESFTVSAPEEYEAIIELARQVGIELEDG
jgi:hypothetical protein